jgi:hypothetical protein
MDAATEHLRALAGRVVAEALRRVPLQAALLAGSAGRGDADFYSDIDLLLYVDEVPPPGTLAGIRGAVGGGPVIDGGDTDGFETQVFDLAGVRTEVSFVTVARVDWRLDQLLRDLEEIDNPLQKIALGMLEGLPLHGDELIGSWQESLRDYPDPLRRALIERHWRISPLWFRADAIAARDAELWRLDLLLEAAFDLLAVLAALNRLYHSRFELKRMRKVVARMQCAPPNLADRLESLFRLTAPEAAAELGRLVVETRELVHRELPDLDLPLPHPPGVTQQPWSLDE